jgi:outer membrane protein OmpA-like peptidoglycan-associated protein
MPCTSVALRGLALAAMGFGASLWVNTAQAQNVMAFNPYNGVGMQSGAVPPAASTVAPSARTYPLVEAPPAIGMAFNPWRPANTPPGAYANAVPGAYASTGAPSVVAAFGPGQPPPAYTPGAGYPTYGAPNYSFGAGLPPPSGPITSHLTTVIERGDAPRARPTPAATTARAAPSPAPPPTPPVTVAVSEPPAPAPPPPPPVPKPSPPTAAVAVAPAPPPATVRVEPPPRQAAVKIEPAPPPPSATAKVEPAPAAPAPPAPTPHAAEAAAPASPPASIKVEPPPPARTAAAKVSPPEPSTSPAPSAGPAVTVSFAPQSAEITDVNRAALDVMAKSVAQRGVKQIELRAYAGGSDAADARKVALARALSVRSYLIDQGMKARIEVGAFAAAARGAGGDRVDVIVP